MRKFFKTIFFFLLPVCFGLVILEYGMRIVPNDYLYKNNWLDTNISHVHIWTLGSSHGTCGIDPQYFSKSAFNSAHASQTLKYDAFIFNKFINRADSLEWLIMPMSYFTIPSDLEDSEEWWRVKNYCIYYNCPYYKYEPMYHYEIMGNPQNICQQIKRVYRYLIYEEDNLDCDTLGFRAGKVQDILTSEDLYENGAQRAKYHTKDLEKKRFVIHDNTDYMQGIISTCAKRDVQVLLLTMPVCRGYYECVDSVQYALLVNTCERFAAIYNNVQYLNLLKDSRFVEDDFRDADHLSTGGARKLTQLLDGYITNACEK